MKFVRNAIPIVVGVTGHRDLRERDLPQLESAVESVFKELQKDYKSTPLVLLTPLAEGTDRLVARVARDCGVPVVFVAPWPVKLGADLWHRTGEPADFESEHAFISRTIPMPLAEGVAPDDVPTSDNAREKQYRQVGRYIARHSQILIALWDGNESPDGGTASVIHCHTRGDEAPFAPVVGVLDRVENGPVYHITTPRESTRDCTIGRTIRYPSGYGDDAAAQEYFKRLWGRINEYNADIKSHSRIDDLACDAADSRLLSQNQLAIADDDLQVLMACYSRANAAARRYQRFARRAAVALFAAVAVAVVLFETYAHLATSWLWLLGGYISLLLAGGVLVHFTRRFRWQEKHIDYRALAEALRVQVFWRLGERADSVADHYLRNFRSELDWTRRAMQACHLVTGGHGEIPARPAEKRKQRLEAVLTAWVADQSEYFNGSEDSPGDQHHGGTAQRNHARHRFFDRTAVTCYVLAVVLAVVLLAVHWRTEHEQHALIVVVFLLAAGAAIVHEFAELAGYAAHANRYRWMGSLFRQAATQMRKLIDENRLDEAEQLIYDLGIEALSENADWVRQNRLRPLKSPSPG